MKKSTVVKNVVLKPVFTDKRGDIFDLVEENVGHTGMVTFTRGAVRARHYHLRSTQYSYVIEGTLKLAVSDIDGKHKKEYLLKPGTLSTIPPMVVHTYTALSKARMLDLTTLSRKARGYEKDTRRVADNL